MSLDPSVTAILYTAVAGLCTAAASLIAQIFQFRRESRAHQWQIEQSARDREERESIARELKAHNDKNADRVSANTSQGVQVLAEKIAENTEISVIAFKEANDAFKEANDVNAKIALIGGQILAGKNPPKPPQGDKAKV